MKPNKEYYPLTSGQMGLVMSDIFTLAPWANHETNMLGAYFMIPENCDFDALERAFNRVVEQNDALRLRIVRKGLGLRQYIKDYEPRRLEIVTIEDSREAIDAYIAGAYKHLLKVTSEDLVWAQMARFGTGGILLMRFHHICSDGYSLSLLFKALERYYDCCAAGEDFPQEKTYSVTKHFETEQKYLRSKQCVKDKEFWRHAYNTQRDYKFPLGHRSAVHASDNLSTTISGELYQKLSDFCRDNNCSMQAVIMALAAIQVYAGTGAKNFALSSISHNRMTPALKQTMGCIMSGCQTFFDIDTSMSINEFAQDTYISVLTHLSHGRLPMAEQNKFIYKESFKHFFNFCHQWLNVSNMDLAGTIGSLKYQAAVLPRISNASQLYCAVLELPSESLDIALTYQTRKFTAAQVQGMLDSFYRLVAIVLDDPTRTIEEVVGLLKSGR